MKGIDLTITMPLGSTVLCRAVATQARLFLSTNRIPTTVGTVSSMIFELLLDRKVDAQLRRLDPTIRLDGIWCLSYTTTLTLDKSHGTTYDSCNFYRR